MELYERFRRILDRLEEQRHHGERWEFVVLLHTLEAMHMGRAAPDADSPQGYYDAASRWLALCEGTGRGATELPSVTGATIVPASTIRSALEAWRQGGS